MATEVEKTEAPATELVGQRTVGETLRSTFSTETREEQARLYLALDSAKSAKKEKLINKPFLATNLIIREESYVDPETGRISDAPSVTIETADGDSFYMSSHTLAESAANMAVAFRADEWKNDPMPVQIVDGMSAKGRTFYRLVPALG